MLHYSNIFMQVLTLFMFILITLVSVFILLSRNLNIIVIVNSTFSLFCAILYSIMAAPDVALTESAVGAGLSTVLYLVTILLTRPSNSAYIHININKQNKAYASALFCLLCLVFVIFVIGLVNFPMFGNINNPAINETYRFYVEKSYAVYNIENMITIILGSFRGFDTLGEALVIFTAAISVIALIKQYGTNKD